MNTKTCNGCGNVKARSEFSANRTSRDGLYSLCRSCKSERAATYRAENIEKIRAAKAAYRLENAEKVRATKAAYYAANAESVKAKVSAWVRDNRDKARANGRKWRRANPDKMKAAHLKYYGEKPFDYAAHVGASRARRRGSPTASPGTTEWDAIVAVYAKCAELIEATGVDHEVDHVQPLSHGGGHFADNLQILTAAEHRRKSAQDRRFGKAARDFAAIL